MGGLRKGSIGEVDPVPGVLPALIDQASTVETFILDKAVSVLIPIVLDPVPRTVRMRLERGDGLLGNPPAAHFTQHNEEQRCGIQAAVVNRFTAQGQSAGDVQPYLMQDLAGFLLGHLVYHRALTLCQGLQCTKGQ